MTDRRQFIQNALSGLACLALPKLAFGRKPSVMPVTERVFLIDGVGANVLALDASSRGGGLVLVDSGAPGQGDALMAALRDIGSGRVETLFNTHYHIDQTGSNEVIAAGGARILAHYRTRHWMATDYWVPREERYQNARPAAALPTETFHATGSFATGGERIDYGHLLEAHTSGDIYVFFRDSNVLAVGDVASPDRDPVLDYFTGAWIGGRADAMGLVLELAGEDTRIVPAYGRVLTRAEFQIERDMMEGLREVTFDLARAGMGAEDMLAAGILDGLPYTWKDPYRFLYDTYKGLWAHHNKIGANIL